MRPSHALETMRCLFPSKQPLFLWGPPGVGKSALVRQAATHGEYPVIDIRCVLLDPIDLRGLPFVNKNGQTQWAPPCFLPLEGRHLIFFDELPQAPRLVQAGLLQLILDRQLGEYRLPPDCVMVAAGNRLEDRAGGHEVITSMLNRFVHVDVETSNDDWMLWASQNSIDPTIRGYIAFCPGALMDFDPTRKERAFPTPRSWEALSLLLPFTPEHLLLPTAAGRVGPGRASGYMAFRETYLSLPDVDKVIANPSQFKPPTELSVCYAFTVALAERAKGAPLEKLNNILIAGGKMRDEFAGLMLIECVQVNKAVVKCHEFGPLSRRLKHILQSAA